nr:hypothetical protein [Tanacetum cinerariifolium]
MAVVEPGPKSWLSPAPAGARVFVGHEAAPQAGLSAVRGRSAPAARRAHHQPRRHRRGLVPRARGPRAPGRQPVGYRIVERAGRVRLLRGAGADYGLSVVAPSGYPAPSDTGWLSSHWHCYCHSLPRPAAPARPVAVVFGRARWHIP